MSPPPDNNINSTRPDSQSRAGSISVRFQLSNPKQAESSLLCTITANGQSAGRFVAVSKVNVTNWAQSLQKMLDDSPESKLTNEQLEFVRIEIKRTALRLQLEGKTISAQTVKAAYLEIHGYKPTAKPIEPIKPLRPNFQACFIAFFNHKSNNKRRPVTDRTRESYWRYKNNLDKYLKASRVKRLYADQMTHEWAEKYIQWLFERLENDYANNNVQMLKSVLQYAEDTKLIDHNPLRGFKFYDKNHYDTTHLSMEQVNQLATFDFTKLPIHPKTAQSLREEADCFVITCFTAQHHSDFHERGFELFVHPQDGRTWIRDNRNKTGTPYTLPVHPVALGIIEKYGGIEKLPVKSNVKRNKLLKEIASHCGIAKHLSTKIGRKTFANYALNTLRMRQETVAAILGHRTTKFIKFYASISEESIAAEYRF
jgi:site-specific recombinase XerD